MVFFSNPCISKTLTSTLVLTALALPGLSITAKAMELQDTPEKRSSSLIFMNTEPEEKVDNKTTNIAYNNKIRDTISSFQAFLQGNFDFHRNLSSLFHFYIIDYYRNNESPDSKANQALKNLEKTDPTLFSLFNKEKNMEETIGELNSIFLEKENDSKQLRNLKKTSMFLVEKLPQVSRDAFPAFAKGHALPEAFHKLSKIDLEWIYAIIEKDQDNIEATLRIKNASEEKDLHNFFIFVMMCRNSSLENRMERILVQFNNKTSPTPLVFNDCEHKDSHETLRARITQTTYDFFDSLLKETYPKNPTAQRQFESSFSADFRKEWDATPLYQKYLRREIKNLVVDDCFSDYIYHRNKDVPVMFNPRNTGAKFLNTIHASDLHNWVMLSAAGVPRTKMEATIKAVYKKEIEYMQNIINTFSVAQFGKTPAELKKEKTQSQKLKERPLGKKELSTPAGRIEGKASTNLQGSAGEQKKESALKKQNVKGVVVPAPTYAILQASKGETAQKNPLYKKEKEAPPERRMEVTTLRDSSKAEKHTVSFDNVDFDAIEDRDLRTALLDLSDPLKIHDTDSIRKIFVSLGATYKKDTGSSHHQLIYTDSHGVKHKCTLWKIHGFGREFYSPGEILNYKNILIEWFGATY